MKESSFVTSKLTSALVAASVDVSHVRANLWAVTKPRTEHPSWTRLPRVSFDNALGMIYCVPVAALACIPSEKNFKTHVGDFSVKFRYVIPIELHPTHMDVLILGTSSGTGGQFLPQAKKDTCIGFKDEGDCDYTNLFPNLLVEIPRNCHYRPSKGSFTDVSFTVPVEYSTRIREVDRLPQPVENYIAKLVGYFRADRLYNSSSIVVSWRRPTGGTRTSEWQQAKLNRIANVAKRRYHR